jgi:hypothetical protein
MCQAHLLLLNRKRVEHGFELVRVRPWLLLHADEISPEERPVSRHVNCTNGVMGRRAYFAVSEFRAYHFSRFLPVPAGSGSLDAARILLEPACTFAGPGDAGTEELVAGAGVPSSPLAGTGVFTEGSETFRVVGTVSMERL